MVHSDNRSGDIHAVPSDEKLQGVEKAQGYCNALQYPYLSREGNMEKNWYDVFDGCMNVIFAILFALFGGTARAALSQRKPRTLYEFVASLVVAGFAGAFAYKLLCAYGVDSEIAAAASGMAGLLGDDILSSVLSIGAQVRKDPKIIWTWWKKGKDEGVIPNGK